METTSLQDYSQEKLSPKELIQKYIRFLPWVLLSLAICLSIAYLRLRYATPIYNVAGKLLVKSQNPYSNNSEKFGNILELPGNADNLNNEIEIIKSRSMAQRVIRSLDMQKQFAIKGKIRTASVRPSDIPFYWDLQKVTDSTLTFGFVIKILNQTQFQLNEDTTVYYFNRVLRFPTCEFQLVLNPAKLMPDDANQYIISWVNKENMAANLASSINVARSEGASVINLTYGTENTKIGLNIVDQYMREYLQANFEEKKVIAFSTLDFIDTQLDTLKRELGRVENNLQNFREKNEVFDPQTQSQMFFNDVNESSNQIGLQSVKLKIIDYLLTYMGNPANAHKIVPSNLGIEEASLSTQINEFNSTQVKRETLLKSTEPDNPLVTNLETVLEKQRENILQNLRNVREAQNIIVQNLNETNSKSLSKVRAMPAKQKQLLEVTRQQAIFQELYSFLLTKKMETAISSASTTADIQILEPAMAGSVPISPNPSSMYVIALIAGLAIPIGIVFLLEYLNDKVKSKNDILRVTSAPILGEVGHATDTGALIVKNNNRSYLAEQFRIIRSNLQYILPKDQNPVILVTSTFSGEGKSLVSTNLGAVLALSGKKTCILELDIRKPKILKGLGMNERKGITNYLVSSISIEEIIYPVPDVDNLYVIPCGPVPPNPAEILLDEKVEVLFRLLKEKFDAIVIDSAPVGMVSDAVTLGAYANTSIYIVRHNYTLKKQIELIEKLYRENKLPRISVVINDIAGRSSAQYGYGYGYGYGFGYSSAKQETKNAYFENEGNGSWFSRIFSKKP